MNSLKIVFFAAASLAIATGEAWAEPKTVASIKPVHSLVAGIMRGVGAPGLIVDGAGSPHDYALKPSQARMLQEADLVFWVGPELETFLKKPIRTIAAEAVSVALIDSPGLWKLGWRQGGAFEGHEHEREHNEHNGHEEHKDHDDEHDEHDEHAHDGFNPHIWLDPLNAKFLVREIADALVKIDPVNARTYKSNANAVAAKLSALADELSPNLAPVRDKRFIVFHDAYEYFEMRFGMEAAGAIAISSEVMPGAKRLDEIGKKLQRLGATCVFAEPQFTPKFVSVVMEGTNAKFGVLDPLGATLENGPDLYFSLIREMAASLRKCLSGTD